jgi:hypothetical protein
MRGNLQLTHVVETLQDDAAARFSCLERVYVEKNIAVYKLRR